MEKVDIIWPLSVFLEKESPESTFIKLHVLITVITMEGFSQFGINDKKWNLESGSALRLNLTPRVRLFDVISPLLLRRWDGRVEYKPADVTSDLQPEEKIKPVLFRNRSSAAACAGFTSWLNKKKCAAFKLEFIVKHTSSKITRL